jgi:HEPN domain-containing protein
MFRPSLPADFHHRLLVHEAAAFLRISESLQQEGRGSAGTWGARILAMHQSVELLVKAIALRNVDYFQCAMRGHDVLAILRKHKNAVPLFKDILDSADQKELLKELYAGYQTVRYGEASVSYDDDTWTTFIGLANRLNAQANAEPIRGRRPLSHSPSE